MYYSQINQASFFRRFLASLIYVFFISPIFTNCLEGTDPEATINIPDTPETILKKAILNFEQIDNDDKLEAITLIKATLGSDSSIFINNNKLKQIAEIQQSKLKTEQINSFQNAITRAVAELKKSKQAAAQLKAKEVKIKNLMASYNKVYNKWSVKNTTKYLINGLDESIKQLFVKNGFLETPSNIENILKSGSTRIPDKSINALDQYFIDNQHRAINELKNSYTKILSLVSKNQTLINKLIETLEKEGYANFIENGNLMPYESIKDQTFFTHTRVSSLTDAVTKAITTIKLEQKAAQLKANEARIKGLMASYNKVYNKWYNKNITEHLISRLDESIRRLFVKNGFLEPPKTLEGILKSGSTEITDKSINDLDQYFIKHQHHAINEIKNAYANILSLVSNNQTLINKLITSLKGQGYTNFIKNDNLKSYESIKDQSFFTYASVSKLSKAVNIFISDHKQGDASPQEKIYIEVQKKLNGHPDIKPIVIYQLGQSYPVLVQNNDLIPYSELDDEQKNESKINDDLQSYANKLVQDESSLKLNYETLCSTLDSHYKSLKPDIIHELTFFNDFKDLVDQSNQSLKSYDTIQQERIAGKLANFNLKLWEQLQFKITSIFSYYSKEGNDLLKVQYESSLNAFNDSSNKSPILDKLKNEEVLSHFLTKDSKSIKSLDEIYKDNFDLRSVYFTSDNITKLSDIFTAKDEENDDDSEKLYQNIKQLLSDNTDISTFVIARIMALPDYENYFNDEGNVLIEYSVLKLELKKTEKLKKLHLMIKNLILDDRKLMYNYTEVYNKWNKDEYKTSIVKILKSDKDINFDDFFIENDTLKTFTKIIKDILISLYIRRFTEQNIIQLRDKIETLSYCCKEYIKQFGRIFKLDIDNQNSIITDLETNNLQFFTKTHIGQKEIKSLTDIEEDKDSASFFNKENIKKLIRIVDPYTMSLEEFYNKTKNEFNELNYSDRFLVYKYLKGKSTQGENSENYYSILRSDSNSASHLWKTFDKIPHKSRGLINEFSNSIKYAKDYLINKYWIDIKDAFEGLSIYFKRVFINKLNNDNLTILKASDESLVEVLPTSIKDISVLKKLLESILSTLYIQLTNIKLNGLNSGIKNIIMYELKKNLLWKDYITDDSTFVEVKFSKTPKMLKTLSKIINDIQKKYDKKDEELYNALLHEFVLLIDSVKKSVIEKLKNSHVSDSTSMYSILMNEKIYQSPKFKNFKDIVIPKDIENISVNDLLLDLALKILQARNEHDDKIYTDRKFKNIYRKIKNQFKGLFLDSKSEIYKNLDNDLKGLVNNVDENDYEFVKKVNLNISLESYEKLLKSILKRSYLDIVKTFDDYCSAEGKNSIIKALSLSETLKGFVSDTGDNLKKIDNLDSSQIDGKRLNALSSVVSGKSFL